MFTHRVVIRRYHDGSIDFDFYRGRAHRLRQKFLAARMRALFRRVYRPAH